MAVQGAGVGSDLRNCVHLRPGLAQRDGGRLHQPQHELQPQGGRGDGAEAGGQPREGVEHCPVMSEPDTRYIQQTVTTGNIQTQCLGVNFTNRFYSLLHHS